MTIKIIRNNHKKTQSLARKGKLPVNSDVKSTTNKVRFHFKPGRESTC